MKETKENVKPVITGGFSAQRFYDTLAMILSQKYSMEITVKVEKKGLEAVQEEIVQKVV